MSTDRRILNLPLIASGNVTNNIVLPLDDPSDNLTKKINLNQIKNFVLSGSVDNNFYTTGTTLIGGIAYFNRTDMLSAYTLNLTSLTGDSNTFITATTYNDLTNTITLTDNANTSFNVYIDSVSGLTVNGTISATTISGGTLYGDGSNLIGISTQDVFVTGGTYSNGTAIFTNNTGGTFNVTGFTTGNTLQQVLVNGNISNGNNIIMSESDNIIFKYAGYNNSINTNTLTSNRVILFPDNSGTVALLSDIQTFTGGTVTGATNFTNGLTANTISATTYFNLPDNVTGNYLPLSGGTVTGQTFFTSGLTITGDTIITDSTGTSTAIDTSTRELVDPSSFVSVDWENRLLYDSTGSNVAVDWGVRQVYDELGSSAIDWSSVRTLTKSDGTTVSFDWENGILTGQTNIESSTISATTYLNLPINTDVFVTGGTYSAGTITFTNTTGGTFNVTDVLSGSIYTDTDNYTSGITKTISHNLNTTNILVQIIDTNTNELIYGSVDNYQTNSVDVTLNQTLSNIKVVIVGTSYFEGSNNLPSCEIRIQGASGLSNTNNGSDFLVLFNTTTYNSSPTTFTITNSKVQLLKPGRYMIKGRYSSYDMTDATDFLRVAVISATTSSNGDLGTKIEYLDQGFIGTTGSGEASKAGSMVLNAVGNEWIGLVVLHGGASGGGGGNQGYPVFDNTFFNQPYLEIIRLGN